MRPPNLQPAPTYALTVSEFFTQMKLGTLTLVLCPTIAPEGPPRSHMAATGPGEIYIYGVSHTVRVFGVKVEA